MLYITGGVGFVLSILAIILVLIFHKKDKSKLIPVILYCFGLILFLGSGFLHWRGFELHLPWQEPTEDVQPAEAENPDAPDTSNE